MNTKTTPKDFFLHLGATVALYVAAGALINLSFSVINYYFPDALAGYFYGNAVAWPISILVVLVPILYILEWLINRDIKKIPEKADLVIRKWRIYLTLFLAVVLMGGDLIALINTYLNGEITSRLVWKVVAVLFIAGSIGKYYYFSLNTAHRWSKCARRMNAWFGLVLVIAAIVVGFIAVGSPAKQRAIRFDQQRVNDLTNIQWQVTNYWQKKQMMPSTLSDLDDSISGFVVPVDPDTYVPYEYSYKGLTGIKGSPSSVGGPSFELCATFSADSVQVNNIESVPAVGKGGGIQIDSWSHSAGRVCFNRVIDPALYPPVAPIK